MNNILSYLSKLSPSARELLKFALVGGLGTITNLVIFTILVKFTNIFWFEMENEKMFNSIYLEIYIASIICFIVAASQNYLLNEKWTFNPTKTNKLHKHRYIKFISFSLLALVINIGFLGLTLELMETYYFINGIPKDSYWTILPQICGISAGMLVNFTLSKLVTFR